MGSISLAWPAGLTNLYTQYIATPEEYEAQRYEGECSNGLPQPLYHAVA